MNNIEKVFEAASEQDIKLGMAWYPYASYIAGEIATELGVPKYKVCAVISALSPNNKWERNLKDAKSLIQGWKVGNTSVKVCTFNSNKEKAIRILDGEKVETVLTGPKTWAFYNCILNPASSHVTIDFHAANIHDGELGKRSLSRKQYSEISKSYISTADKLRLHPSTLQAITWVVWRENNQQLVATLKPLNL